MKLAFEKEKIYFELLISFSFDVLHCSTIVCMIHIEPMFQDFPFNCNKKVPKNLNQFCHFCHGAKPAKFKDCVDSKDGLLNNKVCTVKFSIGDFYFSLNTAHTELHCLTVSLKDGPGH